MMANSISETSNGTSSVVELGFLEKAPSWLLKSKFFRSKVGGKPAWLNLENLPSPADLTCKKCLKPFSFLMQVYAPVNDSEDAFHRTLFIFMCSDGKCCQKFSNTNFLVYRNQLPRRNGFYEFEPPVEKDEGSDKPSAAMFNTLCDVCGCKGDVKCDKCAKRVYCSDAHKVIDWKAGHEGFCCPESDETKSTKKKKKQQRPSCVLPEWELVIDTEVLPPQPKEKSDQEKMKEYERFLQSERAKHCIQDNQLDELEGVVKKSDKMFNKFQKRVAFEPDQVLRYQRSGTPLYMSSEHVPAASDIPPCKCGSKRTFEFQVMPQLLNHLQLDAVEASVDWGTLLVYTCSKSCSRGSDAYTEEFLWKQDCSDDIERS